MKDHKIVPNPVILHPGETFTDDEFRAENERLRASSTSFQDIEILTGNRLRMKDFVPGSSKKTPTSTEICDIKNGNILRCRTRQR